MRGLMGNLYKQDVAAASLFVACKIEDTLKKSREILATSYNIRHPQSEPINSDSPVSLLPMSCGGLD
jgi:hypothetical protein